jgi:hypothetical protein
MGPLPSDAEGRRSSIPATVDGILTDPGDFVPTRPDDWRTAEVPTTVVLDIDNGTVLTSLPVPPEPTLRPH